MISWIVLFIKKEGKTAIMVTHDIREAKNISDKIIMMKKGRILWQGNPEAFDEGMLE